MIVISPIIRIFGMIASLILYFIAVCSCYGGLIPPTVTPVGSVMTIAMPYIVTFTAIVICAWFCTGHWIIGSIGVLALLACASPIRMWFPMNGEQKSSPDAETFTILTWNVLHGEDLGEPDSKLARTLETILREDADIVCLQETFGFEPRFWVKYDQAIVDSLMAHYPYELGNGSYDLRIISKYPLRHTYFGNVNHFVLGEYFTVKLSSREISMANVHLPSFALNADERDIFSIQNGNDSISEKKKLTRTIYHKLRNAIPGRAEAASKVTTAFQSLAMPAIICGDFNDVPASWTYRLFLKSGYKDAYTETNFWPTFTYYPHGFYFHLDQIFYRGSIKALNVKRIPVKTSDHYALKAEFEILSDPY